MAVQDTDLLLVQRGNTPFRSTAQDLSTKIRGDIEVTVGGDIPIATPTQLGVIRVGNNLQIDGGTGVMDAVIPPGLEFQGTWNNAGASPSTVDIIPGNFWIWDGGNGVVLAGATWSAIQNETINDRDRVVWSAVNNWAIVRDNGGLGGAVVAVTGTAPIEVAGTAANPDVSITAASGTAAGSMSSAHWTKLEGIEAGAEINVDPNMTYTSAANNGTLTLTPGNDVTVLPVATQTDAGLMSAADKATLDGLVSTPGGVQSITARNGITNNGTAGAPILDVDFGALPNGNAATAQVMPYDISALGDLP